MAINGNFDLVIKLIALLDDGGDDLIDGLMEKNNINFIRDSLLWICKAMRLYYDYSCFTRVGDDDDLSIEYFEDQSEQHLEESYLICLDLVNANEEYASHDGIVNVLAHEYLLKKDYLTASKWYSYGAEVAAWDNRDELSKLYKAKALKADNFEPWIVNDIYTIEKKKKKHKKKKKAKEVDEQYLSVEEQDVIHETGFQETINNRKFENTFSFSIDEEFNDRVSFGTWTNDSMSLSATYIKSTEDQSKNLSTLQDFEKRHKNILHVLFEVKEKECTKFLVCEPVIPIEKFFKEKQEEIEKARTTPLEEKGWWKAIADVFNQIFSDVTGALIFLHSEGRGCGWLLHEIYVSYDGRGKILPSMDPGDKEVGDIHCLRKMIAKVIGGPFDDEELKKEYDLPIELKHFWQFVIPMNLQNFKLKGWFLLYHPYFWNSEERIKFVQNLHDFLKEDAISWMHLEDILSSRGTFGVRLRPTWPSKLKPRTLTSSIYNVSYTNKVEEYTSPLDVNRFIIAVLSHANDNRFRKDRISIYGLNVKFSKPDIEKDLIRVLFPEVYIEMYESMCTYASDSNTAGIDPSPMLRRFLI